MSNLLSNCGREILPKDGFMYIFDKFNFNHTKRFWRCRYKDTCNCRIHTGINDYIIQKKINDHKHDSEAAKIEVEAAITKIKTRALQTMGPTSVVINECVGPLSEAAKVSTHFRQLFIFTRPVNLNLGTIM